MAETLHLPRILVEIMFRRGLLSSEEAARAFLCPRLAALAPPMLMKGMAEAAALIAQAVAARRPVIIHGDYDVDGITSAVLLAGFLRKLGLEADCYLPNRLSDEYGLTKKSVDAAAAQVRMPAVLITADCGISSPEEVRYAKELGFAVLISDHHEPRASVALPAAEAVINPRQPGCPFPYKELSGAGVVFFLSMAIRRSMVEHGVWTEATMPNLRDELDLVALGTVADVMPLTGLNRILVKAGLEVLAERRRLGLRALCERAGVDARSISAEQIAYQLAPRINAAGRLGRPELAARLLLAQDDSQAAALASELEAANQLRRDLEAAVLGPALIQAGIQADSGRNCLILRGNDWHPGLIGIIAARMIDAYHLPTLVFTGDSGQKDLLKGSGRSVPGLNLHHLLEQCRAWIVRFGGHTMAAGLTVHCGMFEAFSEAFHGCVCAAQAARTPRTLALDAALDAEKTDWQHLAQALQALEPFGQGNPEPVFLLRNLQLREVRTLREHLRFAVPVRGSLIKGIGFFMAAYAPCAAQPVDLCFKLKLSSFGGRQQLEFQAAALRPAQLQAGMSS